MASAPPIRLNPAAALRREQIGASEFCIVVDDFLADPDALVEHAVRHRADFSHPNVGYPGMQLRVDDMAMADIFRFIRSKMSREFAFMRSKIGIRSLLSMVTLPPEELVYMQRICHIDSNPGPGRDKYAALVYLFHDEALGGTSFYRWRDEQLVWQGVELLKQDAAAGEAFMQEHFASLREPPHYMTDSSDVAERLYTVPPRFNRFVFYSGDMPHSAAITAPDRLTDDPRTGRLTLNLFFSVLPNPGLAAGG